MTELKTLKDLKFNLSLNIDWTKLENIKLLQDNGFSEKELKQEAIKWIKEIKKVTIYPYGKDIPIINNSNKLAKFINSEIWIKHFFNITEEDLK